MVSSKHNIHANLIEIDGKGVLITGQSGTGKTLLALHLFRRCSLAKIDVHWIADDQTLLFANKGKLIGSCPGLTRGMAEIRGFGIAKTPATDVQETTMALRIDLVTQSASMRMWDGQTTEMAGINLETLTLDAGNVEAASNAVLAMLGHPIWV